MIFMKTAGAAMKMELPFICPDDGTITEFKVKEADPVSEGDIVVVLEVQ